MAAPGGIWVVMLFFAALGCLGVFLLYKGYQQMSLKRLIENLPTSKVRSIAMGLVELKGTVMKAARVISAPFSGKECVHYSWCVEQQYRDKDGHEHWKTIASGSQGEKFYLKDETGKVIVDPIGAKVQVSSSFKASSGLGVDPPAQVMKFLKEKNIRFEGFLGINKPMRYVESRLSPGDKIFLLGNAQDNPDVNAAADHTQNVLIGKGGPVFLITDKEEKNVVFWAGFAAVAAMIFGGLMVLGGFGSAFVFFIMALLA